MIEQGTVTGGWTLMIASAPPLAGRAASAAPPAATGAQTGAESTPLPPAGGLAPGGGTGNMTFLFVMVGMLVLMIAMSAMTGRKEKKRRAEMLSSLGTHDRVQTIGGVIGTIVSIRDDEVVLRVDDASNVRITFAKSAVSGVLSKKEGRTQEAQEPVATR